MNTLSQNYRVLLIEDDREMRQSLEHLLQSAGWQVETTNSALDVEKKIETSMPDVLLSDVKMPGRSGLELLDDISDKVAPPLVLMSAHGDIAMAVKAIQNGAYSFLEKPFEPRRLLSVLDHAAEQNRLQENTRRLKDRLADLSGLNRIFIGNSATVKNIREQVLDYAQTGASVMIVGETGTGKELVAKALHDLSSKSESPFEAVNCAAIPISEFEEIFFGRKGGVRGLVAKAEGGVLFLDEISSAAPEIQAKLLRFIETKQYTPLGEEKEITSDTRIISATNEDPGEAIKAGHLREDLFYRLNALILTLPSLRDNKDDIPLLFEHFLAQFSRLYEVAEPEQTPADFSALLAHDWPGNVRELRSLAERCVLSSSRGDGSAAKIITQGGEDVHMSENLRSAVASLERTLIAQAIKKHHGRMDEVAAALGIGRRTLNEKIVKLGLNKHDLL